MEKKKSERELVIHQGFLELAQKWIWDSGPHDKNQKYPHKRVADQTRDGKLEAETRDFSGSPKGRDLTSSLNPHPN